VSHDHLAKDQTMKVRAASFSVEEDCLSGPKTEDGPLHHDRWDGERRMVEIFDEDCTLSFGLVMATVLRGRKGSKQV